MRVALQLLSSEHKLSLDRLPQYRATSISMLLLCSHRLGGLEERSTFDAHNVQQRWRVLSSCVSAIPDV